MKGKPRLVAVADEPPIDIHVQARAEILARDWAAVHIAADRRKQVHLADTPSAIRRLTHKE